MTSCKFQRSRWHQIEKRWSIGSQTNGWFSEVEQNWLEGEESCTFRREGQDNSSSWGPGIKGEKWLNHWKRDGKESLEVGGTLREVRKAKKKHTTKVLEKAGRGLKSRSQSFSLGVKEWTLFLGTEDRRWECRVGDAEQCTSDGLYLLSKGREGLLSNKWEVGGSTCDQGFHKLLPSCWGCQKKGMRD